MVFCDLKLESIPLSVPKKIGDCMRSRNGSTDATHTLIPCHFTVQYL
jgi:hypothetical protein